MSLLSLDSTLHAGDGSQSISSGSTLVEERPKTGRPKEWTKPRLRKLTRLYAYSELPRKDIAAALCEKNWKPSEASVAKHSKALFGADPRWLKFRPKDRDDMNKRIEGLKSCETRVRNTKPDIQDRIGQAVVAFDTLDTVDLDPQLPFWSEDPIGDLLAPGASYMFTTESTTDTHSPIVYSPPPVSESTWRNALDIGSWPRPPNPHPQSPRERGAFGLFPSTDGVPKAPSISPSASSTHISTTSMKQRLPHYSIRYLKKIVRLRDAHSVADAAVATVSTRHSSISSPTDTSTTSGLSEPKLTSKPESIDSSKLQSFPDTFLVLDRSIKHQGICIPGLKPHDNKSCWCAVVEELGPRSTEFWTHHSAGDFLDVNARDVFQNSILHLLAARGASWESILEVVHLGADINAKNVAGQTFLHVADSNIIRNLMKSPIDGYLSSCLETLDGLGFEPYQCDFFGRNVFHMIYHCAKEQGIELDSMDGVSFNFSKTRDAFGCNPNKRKTMQVGAGDAVQLTGLLAPACNDVPPTTLQTTNTWASRFSKSSAKRFLSLPTQEYCSKSSRSSGMPTTNAEPQADHASTLGTKLTEPELTKNARLIETARLAANAPFIEESEGRNGLQCLAEMILDIHIENDKITRGSTVPTSKRKHDQQNIDHISQKLASRYQLVKVLVSRGVNINHYDGDGSTVLMTFIAHRADGEDDKTLAEILKYLIRNGANLHLRNRQGETALHVAVRLGRKVATRVLLDHGANVHARNAQGQGVLSVGQSNYLKAKHEPYLYAAIMMCMALAISYGAVATPSVVQEWLPKDVNNFQTPKPGFSIVASPGIT